jgi:hypothetical protein
VRRQGLRVSNAQSLRCVRAHARDRDRNSLIRLFAPVRGDDDFRERFGVRNCIAAQARHEPGGGERPRETRLLPTMGIHGLVPGQPGVAHRSKTRIARSYGAAYLGLAASGMAQRAISCSPWAWTLFTGVTSENTALKSTTSSARPIAFIAATGTRLLLRLNAPFIRRSRGFRRSAPRHSSEFERAPPRWRVQ